MTDNQTTEKLMREFVAVACECEVRDYLISEYAERIEQAIAATLGSGTCENLASYPLVNFECSECGCEVKGGDELGANIENGRWNFCPNCERSVKR